MQREVKCVYGLHGPVGVVQQEASKERLLVNERCEKVGVRLEGLGKNVLRHRLQLQLDFLQPINKTDISGS